MKNNRGSAVVEATIVLPFFIFGMLCLYHMLRCRLLENEIYEACIETAEYIAEVGYINDSSFYLPGIYFPEYVDNEDELATYVLGGLKGVDFLGSSFSGDYFTLRANYTVQINLPFMPNLSEDRCIVITQKYYRGSQDKTESEDDEAGKYVYVTDNMEAYHSTRLCSHLKLSTKVVGIDYAVDNGFEPCEFCGNANEKKMVIVTDTGGKYHRLTNCSGLKRTIYRVKLSEIEGVNGCMRCVGQ